MKGHSGTGVFVAGASLLLVLATAATAAPPPADVPARGESHPVTPDVVRQGIDVPLYKMELQAHELRGKALGTLVAERLLALEAKKRNLSVAQLLEAEAQQLAGPAPVIGSDDSAVPGFTPRERQVAARDALLERLTRPQQPAPLQDALSGGIARGNDAAPVTIVAFTDFHCPFCRMAEATIAELRAKYGDRIRYVHRDYPIAKLHPQAPRAHIAARCAAAQDRFWPYHDKLFAAGAEVSDRQLRAFASELELDTQAFARCLDSDRTAAALQADLAAGSRLGVTGTPTFFVNGQRLEGAQPLQRFVEAVEAELAKPAAARTQAATSAAAPRQ